MLIRTHVLFRLNITDSPTTDPNNYGPIHSGPTSYAKVIGEPSRKSVNFGTIITPAGNRVYVAIALESIRAISQRFGNTTYGFFLGKRVAYPVVANYVRNTWGKYGLVKSMFNSSIGLFCFQFSSMDSLDSMLENGRWFIRNNPLILNKLNLDVNLLKEDVGNVSVWIKLHGVSVTAFNEDGLSAIAPKFSTPLMLDSYTSDMYMQSCGSSSYAREMIKVWAGVGLKETIVVAMPKLVGMGYIRVLFVLSMSGNLSGADVVKNLKKPWQAPTGVSVGPKVGFKPVKQVYRPVSKKNNANISGNKKKDAESRKEVNNTNPFDVLNSVEKDVDLGTNGGTSNLASKEANSSGSSFWNVGSSSTTTTPIVEKIDKLFFLERQIL
ncbi:zinc finger, CCHC-type containing protein [Tanacetum coccineum]